MKLTFDKNLFTQIGLDSGSLTMLGGVTHRFLEPGQYRGAAYRGKENLGSFYINVDKNSPVAQANIDLTTFESNPAAPAISGAPAANTGSTSCGCQESTLAETKFELNPKGYAVFHVSAGAGGFSVLVAKAVEDPKEQNQFDSRELKGEDIFSAVILRPGTYSVTNALAKGKGEVTVSYPKVGKKPYRPPNPVKVECSARGFEPKNVELQPGQAILFYCKVPSRIKLELLKADDGPDGGAERSRPGWKKAALPEQKAKA
jgi:hypothetical protein